MPAGRPTKYEPKFVKAVDDYLETCGREQTKLPKRVDVALLLGVTEDTLANWGREHEEFLGALTRVDQYQKLHLIDDSFYGGKEINSHIGQFLLEVNHGMIRAEKKILEGSDGQGIKINVKVIEDKTTDNE